MKRVFCHSLGITSDGRDSFEGLPPERFEVYAKRALVLADRDDVIILPPHKETEDISDEVAVLNEVGIGPDVSNVVYGVEKQKEGADFPNGLWKKTKTIEKTNIFPFTGKAALPFSVANQTGAMVVSTSPEMVKKLDGKDFFQNLKMDCIPEGEVLDTEKKIENFFSQINGQKWICKTSQNASGMSMCLISRDNENKNKVFSFLEKGKIPVVQRYHRSDLSPSVNMEINTHGRITDMFLSGQFLSPGFENEKLVHDGNIFPCDIPPETVRYILQKSVDIACRYIKTGHFGPMGIDWIVDSQKILPPMAVEVNNRITAPRYPYEVMKKLGAESFCLLNFDFTPGLKPFDIREKLDDIWFDAEQKKGAIFFNFNRNLGKMAVIALGKNLQESKEVIQEVKKKLS